MKPRTWLLAALAGLALAGGVATDTFAGDESPEAGRRDGRAFRRGARARVVRGRMVRARHARQAGVLQFLGSLALTDAQRALALEKARAMQTVVTETRTEAARILVQAHDAKATGDAAARAKIREDRRALRQRTQERLAPLAREVVASLTPEQRAKIDAAAQARGRTVDEERLVRATTRLLTRPMAVPLLEAGARPR